MRFFSSLMLMFLVTLPAWGTQLVTSITLDKPAKIDGKPLKQGDYRFTYDQDTHKLRVERDGQLVAQPTAQWKDTKYKVPQSAVVFEKNNIKEVDFGGQKGVVELK